MLRLIFEPAKLFKVPRIFTIPPSQTRREESFVQRLTIHRHPRDRAAIAVSRDRIYPDRLSEYHIARELLRSSPERLPLFRAVDTVKANLDRLLVTQDRDGIPV
jgi:hypothetical protein